MRSAREHDRMSKEMDIGSDRVHRMATDLAALEYAANAVRDGGIFHVVTRVAGGDVRLLRKDTEREMSALASHGPVRPEEVVLLPYTALGSVHRRGRTRVVRSREQVRRFG